jgi:hypothetical protein
MALPSQGQNEFNYPLGVVVVDLNKKNNRNNDIVYRLTILTTKNKLEFFIASKRKSVIIQMYLMALDFETGHFLFITLSYDDPN